MANCVATLKACQGPDEFHPYAFDLSDEFVALWAANTPFNSAAVLRPGTTGQEYSSSGGVSNGEQEPVWGDDPVEDGSITWTPQAISFDGLLERITDVVWTAPSGITISDDSFIDEPARQEARIWVTGGTVGRKYVISGLITTSPNDEVYEVRLEMSIK